MLHKYCSLHKTSGFYSTLNMLWVRLLRMVNRYKKDTLILLQKPGLSAMIKFVTKKTDDNNYRVGKQAML